MAEKRKRRKKKLFFPILTAVLLLVFFGMQWYLINSNKIETVKANEGYINDSIVSTGIICRDEIVIDNVTDGYFYYNIENGDRVSSGMLVGNVYPSQNDINLLYTYNNLEDQIVKLKEAENFMSTVNVDISITRRELNNSLADFSRILSGKNFSEINDNVSEMTLHINKINSAMHRQGNISDTILEFENTKNQIKTQISQPVSSVYSPTSGYFVDTVDGYEEIAKINKFTEMSAEEGNAVLSSVKETSNPDIYGKIITNYKWNMCTYVTSAQAANLYEGQKIKLSVDLDKNEFQSVTVEKLIPKDDIYLVVLKSSTMNKNIVSKRITDCEILFSQYKGIKVPVEALRFVDGQQGVYVKFSKLVQFKKVKPVYQDSNYAILPLTPDGENQVELYDDIIVKGVNLYDGKYL